MKTKKLMSLSALCLVGVLGVGLLAGCDEKETKDEDEVCTENCIDDDGEDTSGPKSGLVINNLFGMLNGFTFEGSIDIAYGDIDIGLEFNNGKAVIPLDLSDTSSFDVSKLAVGGDLTITYDEYSITLGVTYLDSAVYVDYGEDSYWSEGTGNSVHFFMANSDIGALINLFSTDDEDASSVDWEELFGLDLEDFQVTDLMTSLNYMTLTTSKDGGPAFSFPLSSLGINDSLLIRTNEDSECLGLECTDLKLGEFTLSIDLSLATEEGLSVTTPVATTEYADLACVTPLVKEIIELAHYEYFVFEGTITLGMSAMNTSAQADIETTLTMRTYNDGHFTMQIDCDIPAASVTFMGFINIDITGYGGGVLDSVDHSHLTVYYDSEDGYTYYYHIDYSDKCEETSDTYEEWGMLSGSEFGKSPFQYILGNMIGCGSIIQSALGGSGSFNFEWGIPSSLNGLISGLTVTEVLDENNQERVADKLELDLALGSIFGGDASIINETTIATTIYDNHSADSIYVALPITGTYSIVTYEFDIILDLTLTDSSETVCENGNVNGENPFGTFEAYIAQHTCECDKCECEGGECDCECECCSGECECYFIENVVVKKSNITPTCSCECEGCEEGECNCECTEECNCAEGCTCTECGCTCIVA